MVQSTTWWVSALCSIRMVGSSATSRCSAAASLSSSDLVTGWIATGSNGSGSTHGSTRAGESLSLNVSADAADIRVAGGADHLGDQRRGRVAAQRRQRVPVGGGGAGQRVHRRRRERGGDEVQ